MCTILPMQAYCIGIFPCCVVVMNKRAKVEICVGMMSPGSPTHTPQKIILHHSRHCAFSTMFPSTPINWTSLNLWQSLFERPQQLAWHLCSLAFRSQELLNQQAPSMYPACNSNFCYLPEGPLFTRARC